MDTSESGMDDLMDLFLQKYAESYQKAQPFPHIAIDGFLNEELLKKISSDFPLLNSKDSWEYRNTFETKFAYDQFHEMPASIKEMICYLYSPKFVLFLEKLTGIEDLIIDMNLNGGGLHQIYPEGKLDIHADYNYHPRTELHRRVNLLLYLNEKWESSWGGNLEFWDEKMEKKVCSFEPYFNRLVIFNSTDTSFHGHPDPLSCPEGVTRKSIALYYYTLKRPLREMNPPHSVLFQRRPQDPIIEEYEELRKKRAIKRIDV